MQKTALGPIAREEAIALDAVYVKFREEPDVLRKLHEYFPHIQEVQDSLKKGQLVLTIDPNSPDRKRPQYLICQVSMVKRNCIQAIDGPVVRVTDGRYSWRVDGCGYCVPITSLAERDKLKVGAIQGPCTCST